MLDGRSSALDSLEKEANLDERSSVPISTKKMEGVDSPIKSQAMDRDTQPIKQDSSEATVNQETLYESTSENSECLHINISQVKTKTVKVPIKIGDIDCSAAVDTGAEVSVLNKDIMRRYQRIQGHNLKKQDDDW